MIGKRHYCARMFHTHAFPWLAEESDVLRISRTRGPRRNQNANQPTHTDKQIEGTLIMLIYSGRHTHAAPLLAEARRMLPGVDPVHLDRVAHRLAARLKENSIEW